MTRLQVRLTEAQIDAMSASGDLDALIETHLFGNPVVKIDPTGFGIEENIGWCIEDQEDSFGEHPYVDGYSVSWISMHKVIKMFRRGFAPGQVAAVIEMRVTDEVMRDDCECRILSPTLAPVYASAQDMPAAVCKAALKAVFGIINPSVIDPRLETFDETTV